MPIFSRRRPGPVQEVNNTPPPTEKSQFAQDASDNSPPARRPLSKRPTPENPTRRHLLPISHTNGRLVTRGINPDGESGRSGFHPLHFLWVAWESITPWNKYMNLLWPFTIAAFVVHYHSDNHSARFALSYIGMVPCASLLGFAGQELARKLPRVLGIMIEVATGGIVEIILFMVLIKTDRGNGGDNVAVIQAAILGSILGNLLLCLGLCFLIGGLKHREQNFHAVVSEMGSGILLVAAFGLLIPSAFYSALKGTSGVSLDDLRLRTSRISLGVSVILFVGYFLYLAFGAVSHHSIFDEVLAEDEEIDVDRERDLAKPKFTLFEACVAIVVAVAFIAFMAYFLVLEIEPLVEQGVPDQFLGLILVPLVEKLAEHITAVDEAYDNQINFALYHCLAPSVQTALFNTPLVVFVGQGLGKHMDLNFEIFMIVLVVLSILVVGNFLRDGSSNFLEGALLLLVYVIIAVTTGFYPANVSTNGFNE